MSVWVWPEYIDWTMHQQNGDEIEKWKIKVKVQSSSPFIDWASIESRVKSSNDDAAKKKIATHSKKLIA